MKKLNKLEPGYYIAEAPATGNAMEDSRYVVFRWTIAQQQIVDQVRRQMKPLCRDGLWHTVRIGPGPQAQFFETLPEWVDERAELRDVLDSGKPAAINQTDAERLFDADGNGVARVDCVHITINDPEIYVGAYGQYCGTHWETGDLT